MCQRSNARTTFGEQCQCQHKCRFTLLPSYTGSLVHMRSLSVQWAISLNDHVSKQANGKGREFTTHGLTGACRGMYMHTHVWAHHNSHRARVNMYIHCMYWCMCVPGRQTYKFMYMYICTCSCTCNVDLLCILSHHVDVGGNWWKYRCMHIWTGGLLKVDWQKHFCDHTHLANVFCDFTLMGYNEEQGKDYGPFCHYFLPTPRQISTAGMIYSSVVQTG